MSITVMAITHCLDKATNSPTKYTKQTNEPTKQLTSQLKNVRNSTTNLPST